MMDGRDCENYVKWVGKKAQIYLPGNLKGNPWSSCEFLKVDEDDLDISKH